MEFRWRKFETIALGKAKFIVGQNLGFDINIMGCEFLQNGSESQMSSMPI
jgi:DNA polymerase-3 subunit alpha